MALVIEDPSGNPYFLVTAVSSKKIITINLNFRRSVPNRKRGASLKLHFTVTQRMFCKRTVLLALNLEFQILWLSGKQPHIII